MLRGLLAWPSASPRPIIYGDVSTNCMTTSTAAQISDDDLIRSIGVHRPDVLVPGYWDSLTQNCKRWADEISVGPYWHDAKNKCTYWRQEYRSEASSDLLSSPGLPSFVSKPVESTRSKLLRRCRQDSAFVGEAIQGIGPPVPNISDLVRTRVACRYIDGVEFLGTKLCELADEMGLTYLRERQGRLEGYFAQHITVTQDVIYRFGGISTQTKVVSEIQIATEFGTRMWDATHPLYESVRGKSADPASWQWKPDDPRFIANQLGHMIHLADGLLMQLRDSTKSTK